MKKQPGKGAKFNERIVYQIQESQFGCTCQAICPELIITAFGDTPEEARNTLRSQISLYLEDCAGLGILDEVLIEAGFYFNQGAWISNEVSPVKDPDIVIL
jgi:hypothetical protein